MHRWYADTPRAPNFGRLVMMVDGPPRMSLDDRHLVRRECVDSEA